MTLNKLASAIAKREGKRSQARIGDIREILKLIAVMSAEDTEANGSDNSNCPLEALTNACNRELDKLRKRKSRGGRG
jgi:hypothetical protein